MKKIILTLSIVAALASCNKEDGMPTPDLTNQAMAQAESSLTVATKSIISTEAVIEDAEDALDQEVELYTTEESAISRAAEAPTAPTPPETPTAPEGHYKGSKQPMISLIPKGSDDLTYPYELIIDYGEGTELEDGRILTGVITVEMSNPRTEEGAVHTVVYDNVTSNGVSVSGSMSKTFSQGGLSTSIEKSFTHTFEDGTTVVNLTTTPLIRTLTAGAETKTLKDNITETTGSTMSSDKEGNVYTKDIIKPLVKMGDYRYIVEGKIMLLNNGSEFATFDYGDGTQDNIMTVTTAEGTEDMRISFLKRVLKDQQE